MDRNGVRYMADRLELDIRRPLRTFSKGMKRQAFLILALCANTDYLLCDEVFDGLDPVVTEAMKNLFGKEIQERALTVVVAATNYRIWRTSAMRLGSCTKEAFCWPAI